MKRANVVIKINCHSRKLLSGIYNACCCKTKEKSLLNGYVEDPLQYSLEMIPHFITIRGFTLIELLVVVLIIGILAAVAVPQYQKAVEKARLIEAITKISAVEKAMDLYVLEHGYEYASFFGQDGIETDIDVKTGVIDNSSMNNSISPYFDYQAYCADARGVYVAGAACTWVANASSPAIEHPREYVLWGERGEQQGEWNHYCEYDDEDAIGTYICTQLFSQGWQQGDLFY